MKQKYLITGLVVATFTSCLTYLTSCADDLVIDTTVDESAYTGIYENNGYLRDGKSNLASSVIELYKDTYTTCLLYTSPSPRDVEESRMPSSA